MDDVPINRERLLLEAVTRSGGQWNTRDLDVEVNRQIHPGHLTVLDELKILERRGLIERVERAEDPPFVGWATTPRGQDRLADLAT
jgi:DNA-binding HxlR family transcriptional regulator